MKIRVPKSIGALNFKTIYADPAENEILLERKLKYRIISILPNSNGKLLVEAQIIF